MIENCSNESFYNYDDTIAQAENEYPSLAAENRTNI